jgi:oligopeptide/dipeptide ABC transporter ATP-binding protein
LREGEELLRVKRLRVSHIDRGGCKTIIDDVDLSVHEGETVGLIGPTGAGKTVTAKAILGVLQPNGAGKPKWRAEGEALYRGRDLFKMSGEELRLLRGDEVSMVFQKPAGSLNPILMVGEQTGEPVDAHEEIERRRLREMVIDHLGRVELPDAGRRFRFFPHQFSGGEAQRIMIASALICNPSLVVADEPTSDLDVTIQRQVLELLKRVKEEFGLSMLLITHDLGVIAEMSDYMYVMYAGRIIEHGDVYGIFEDPVHPFTRGLLRSTPRIDSDLFELIEIPGELPQPPYDIPGCVFHPRCSHVRETCRVKRPVLGECKPGHYECKPGHYVACMRAGEI